MANESPAPKANDSNQPQEGAQVAGNVNTGGGGFVGRDQITNSSKVEQGGITGVMLTGVSAGEIHIHGVSAGISNPDVPPQSWKQEDIDRYLAHMRTLYATTRILGKPEPISLEGIYTDAHLLDKLTARQRFSLEELKERFQQRFESTVLKRWNSLDLVRQSHNLFILGKPGAGKTTLLRYIALQAAQQRLDKLPVFVTLKEWQPNQQGLMPLILKHFEQCGFPDAPVFVEQQLRDGKAILLFDGLDEVNQEHDQQRQLIQQLTEVSERYPHCQCLITCRLATTDYQFPRFQDVEVADFTDDQIRTYVHNWFRDNQEKGVAFFTEFNKPDHQGLRELAFIPLLLSLLCLVFEEGMAFPMRRSELYKEALDVLLRKWDGVRNIRRDTIYRGLSTELKQQMFAAIAAETFEQGDYFFTQTFLKERIETYIARLPPADRAGEVDGMQILQAIEAQHSVLVERAREIYSFSHLTLQEYFTAKYIVDHADRGTVTKLLTATHVTDERWREVLLLTASLLPNADHFFQLFGQTINSLIAEDAVLITLLCWAQDKADCVATPYQRSAIRSYYIYRSLGHDRDRDLSHDRARDIDIARAYTLVLDRDLARTHSHDGHVAGGAPRDSALDLDRSLDSARDNALDIARFLDSARFLDGNPARSLALARSLARSRARALDSTRDLAGDLALACALAHELSLFELHEALAILQLPTGNASSKDWKSFAEKLRTIMIKYRNIGHQWNLNQEKIATLNMYLNTTHLFVKCLDVGVVSNRQALKDSLLLPPAGNPKHQGGR